MYLLAPSLAAALLTAFLTILRDFLPRVEILHSHIFYLAQIVFPQPIRGRGPPLWPTPARPARLAPRRLARSRSFAGIQEYTRAAPPYGRAGPSGSGQER